MIPRGLVPEQLEAEAVEGVRPETCQGRLWISGFHLRRPLLYITTRKPKLTATMVFASTFDPRPRPYLIATLDTHSKPLLLVEGITAASSAATNESRSADLIHSVPRPFADR